MLPSRRCRPQVGSGLGDGTWAPFSAVTHSTCAPFEVRQPIRYALGSSNQVVGACGGVRCSSEIAIEISVWGANVAVGKIASATAEPPPSAAGFVQSTMSLECLGARPKMLVFGTG